MAALRSQNPRCEMNCLAVYSYIKNKADPPDPLKIHEEDIIGVTVLLLTCSYQGQEFLQVRYYVDDNYDDEQQREEPSQKVLIDKTKEIFWPASL
ncbi:probable histone chaperone ASF1A [Olea europaea subsp. europaea]|uniref:Probable histone chaperone ASF1A n=1 Tax=Olea europaea subsp. europaea TaxID=158383 RepID=A0A8S0QL06_OLEEU|nr:probable histone chaperone ASF1A [Olea europaea subsp. europaea]